LHLNATGFSCLKTKHKQKVVLPSGFALVLRTRYKTAKPDLFSQALVNFMKQILLDRDKNPVSFVQKLSCCYCQRINVPG